MSNAREFQGGSPSSSPEARRGPHAVTPPSTPPSSGSPRPGPQPLTQALDRAVALANDSVSAPSGPRQPGVPSLPVPVAVPRDSSPRAPLLPPRQPAAPRRHVQDDSGLPREAPRGLPGSRQAAQYLDLAAAVTSAPVFGGSASAVRGAVSGALWSTSAGFGAYDNQQGVRERHANGQGTGANGWFNRIADVSGFVAGASDATSSVFNYFGRSSGLAASVSTGAAYASNAFWGVAGAIGTGQGVYNLFQSGKSRLASGLQLTGGLLNMAGAGFGAVAAQRASADSDDPAATYYGYASAAAWTLGSVATIASNHLARRAENTRFAQDVENRG